MIWFIYMQSMLLGAYYSKHSIILDSSKTLKLNWSSLLITTILYFASKLFFVKYSQYSEYQIFNQILLYCLLLSVFKLAITYENAFNKMTPRVHLCFKFLADHTLEIYLVQSVIISYLNYGPFPVNWISVTLSIIIAAFVLRNLSQRIINWTRKFELNNAQ